MNAVVISIGDELVLGEGLDTNSAWLSQQLIRLGITVSEHITIPDDLEAIVAHLRRAGAGADVIVASGGLGPTDDDLTRHALAELLGVPLQLHQPSLQHIQGLFARLGRNMIPRNRIQAMIPQGCQVIENPLGTAPGIAARVGRARAFFAPGVPAEMKRMFAQSIGPELNQIIAAAGQEQVVISRTWHTFGMGESDIAELLGDIMNRRRNPVVNSTVAYGIVSIRVNAQAANEQAARELIAPIEEQLRERLGQLVFGCDDETLPAVVGRLLRQRHASLATAESCTGGLLAKALTDIPGSSDYFRCGWVVYSNVAKTSFLQVEPGAIDDFGAVSEPVARQLAQNARLLAQTDYGLGITGIAGPGGQTPDKPVGLVYIGLAHNGDSTVKRHVLQGDRVAVRRRAVNSALDMLRRRMTGHSGGAE